ncbi:hypothetical protein Patl1_27542 [Pistacia atlantica]|uniref:Uncharacterized protein n=1 Tax=Pistacia atlantica TaxID=434234 RepID=A0ACC1BDU9_9ROSI|nr:hypothetical protein Patl1_27542 [Pistacia atlantica]
MSVTACKNLTEIFVLDGEDDNDNNEVIEFCQLRFLALYYLPRLTSFYSLVKKPATLQERQKDEPKSLFTSFYFKAALKKFYAALIQERHATLPERQKDELTPLFNRKVVFRNLEALELTTIDYGKIWDSQSLTLTSSPYKNLTRLIVSDCNKLKCVFPSSIVKSFDQLQHLEINYCKVLKEIVEKGEGEEDTKFFFPQVTFLSLKRLPELESFYPGRHTSEWPMLKNLEVCYCDKVKIFNSKSSEEQLDISVPQSLFLFEKINPHLEKLTLSKMDNVTIWQGQLPSNQFWRLKVLRVGRDKSQFIRSYKERFSHREEENHTETPTQMRMSLFYLQNLEDLHVFECDKLMNLAPSTVSFYNLTVLKVRHCNGMMNLITSSTAKSLEQLRELEIEACKMMIEVVAEGDAGRDEIIVFKNLESLSLDHLESLKCFCSGNCTFVFPALEDLLVKNCPKMKIFCGGVLKTPNLKDDLNATIQQSYKLYKKRERWQLIVIFLWSIVVMVYLNLSPRRFLFLHKVNAVQLILDGNMETIILFIFYSSRICRNKLLLWSSASRRENYNI